jgi:hypothetical protein
MWESDIGHRGWFWSIFVHGSATWTRVGGWKPLERRGQVWVMSALMLLDEMTRTGRRPGWLLVGAVRGL